MRSCCCSCSCFSVCCRYLEVLRHLCYAYYNAYVHGLEGFVGLAILKSQTKDNWRLWSTTPTHRKIGYSSVNAKQSLERSEFNMLSTMWRRANGTRQDARHCGMGSMTSCRGGGSRRNRELAPPTQSPGQNAPGTAAGAQCGWCPGLWKERHFRHSGSCEAAAHAASFEQRS